MTHRHHHHHHPPWADPGADDTTSPYFLSGRHQSQTQIMHAQQQRLARLNHHKERKKAQKAKKTNALQNCKRPTKDSGTTPQHAPPRHFVHSSFAMSIERMRHGLRAGGRARERARGCRERAVL